MIGVFLFLNELDNGLIFLILYYGRKVKQSGIN
jgi:hypothetical protein